MKKLILSSFTILSFGLYSLYKNTGTQESVVTTTNSLTEPSTISTQQQDNTQDAMPGMGSNMHSMMSQYKDGIYTGKTVDAYYGLVQVQATISDGKITSVDFLQYPNDRRTSVYINNQAMPYLKKEAISTQSADVNIVSGATQTSLAFRKSLKSALDQAI